LYYSTVAHTCDFQRFAHHVTPARGELAYSFLAELLKELERFQSSMYAHSDTYNCCAQLQAGANEEALCLKQVRTYSRRRSYARSAAGGWTFWGERMV